ncbi:MAG: 16S rRNA (uracil(1498)-N(3))-methyltransferase [Gammaproteobacteria bacterium]|nr:16S rRNA (uracil(1498)-N(3))-methyltransferase [Gammaproteobacteria bacterium]
MRVVRIHVETPLTPGAEIMLPPESAHHLSAVLRLGPGAVVELFDGSGGSHRGRLVAARKRSVTVQLESFDPCERESPLQLTLVQGISRGPHMDYTLQKAVELGVARVVPVLTGHGNVRLDEVRASRRAGHWRRVVIAACEQCGRNRVPEVSAPQPLAQWLNRDGNPCRLVLDPGADTGLPALPAPAGGVSLLCGPEGGLSEAEVRSATGSGWRAVRMGPRILRTETAPVAALAACQALWGDLR